MERGYRSSKKENGDQYGRGTEASDVNGTGISDSPIEPDSGSSDRKPVLRWILFAAFVILTGLTAYHEALLIRLGGYLVVSHELEESDLIVCLSGDEIERGLGAADVYRGGFAPKVFIAPEVHPDGYHVLARHGIDVPLSIDILRLILLHRQVPEHALMEADRPVGSTMEEAAMVRNLVMEQGYGSLIVVTSPAHTRRAWLTFQRELGKEDVSVRMHPTSYSGFKAEDWWKTRRYVREVVMEYQKLLYYLFKYYL